MPPKSSRRKALHNLETRVETFSSARVKLKKGRSREVTWPHSQPSADLVAQSGFYFTPDSAKEGVDSVTCYMCNCSIKGWEPSDIPNQVHYENSPNCPLATLRQKPWNQTGTDANQVDIDSHHNPHCESSVLVRLQTYFYPLTDSQIAQTIVSQSSDSQYKSFLSLATSFWPHDKKKGWKPISLRMALAGFYYTPETISGDDLCECPYCGLSLDQWEKTNDPFEEHKDRKPNCYFFTSRDRFLSNSANLSEAEIEQVLRASLKTRTRSGLTESSASQLSQDSEGYESTSSTGSNRSSASKKTAKTRSKKRPSNTVFTEEEGDNGPRKKKGKGAKKDITDLKPAPSLTPVLKPELPKTRATRASSIAASTAKAAASARAEARAASSSPKKFRLSNMGFDDDSRLMKPLPSDGRPLSEIITGALKSSSPSPSSSGFRSFNRKFLSQGNSAYDSMASFSGVRVTHSGSVSEKISRFEELAPVSPSASSPRSPRFGKDILSPRFSPPKPAQSRSSVVAALARNKAKQEAQPQSAMDLVLNRSQSLKEQYEKASSAATSALFGRSGTVHGNPVSSPGTESFSHRVMNSVDEEPEFDGMELENKDVEPATSIVAKSLEPSTPLAENHSPSNNGNKNPLSANLITDSSVVLLGTPSVDYSTNPNNIHDKDVEMNGQKQHSFDALATEAELDNFSIMQKAKNLPLSSSPSPTEIYQDPDVITKDTENNADLPNGQVFIDADDQNYEVDDDENMLPLPPPIGEANGASENWSRLSDASSIASSDGRASIASINGKNALPLRPTSSAQRNTDSNNSPRTSIPPLSPEKQKTRKHNTKTKTHSSVSSPSQKGLQSTETLSLIGSNTNSTSTARNTRETNASATRSQSPRNNRRVVNTPNSPLSTIVNGYSGSPVRPRSGSTLSVNSNNSSRLNGSPFKLKLDTKSLLSRPNSHISVGEEASVTYMGELDAAEDDEQDDNNVDEGNEADDEGDGHSTRSTLSPGKSRPKASNKTSISPFRLRIGEGHDGKDDKTELSPSSNGAGTKTPASTGANGTAASPVVSTVPADSHTPEHQTATARPPFGTVARYSAIKAAARATSPRSAAPMRGPLTESPSASVQHNQTSKTYLFKQPHFPLPQETPPAPTPGKRATPASLFAGSTPRMGTTNTMGMAADDRLAGQGYNGNMSAPLLPAAAGAAKNGPSTWDPIDEDCVFDVMTEFERDVDIMLGRSLLREELGEKLAGKPGKSGTSKTQQLEEWLHQNELMDKTVKEFYQFLGKLSEVKLQKRFEALYSKLDNEVQRALTVLENTPTID